MAESNPLGGLPCEVNEFLEAFKSLLKYQDGACSWIDRPDRFEALGTLGITIPEAERIIKEELTDEHIHRGPEPDDHMPEAGVVFVFRCPISDSSDAYVKIGLRLTKAKNNNLRGVIWSFKKWSDSTPRGTQQ